MKVAGAAEAGEVQQVKEKGKVFSILLSAVSRSLEINSNKIPFS